MRIQYGAAPAKIETAGAELRLHLPLPHLAGERSEVWPLGSAAQEATSERQQPEALPADGGARTLWHRQGDWQVAQSGDLFWGCALADGGDAGLEANTRGLYLQLLAMLGEYRLQRAWHFIPRINACDASGLERYRAFCRGRSVAFEAFFPEAFDSRFPAASAVGCEGESFVVYVCARKNAVTRYLENPLQIPAYRYPQQYGPRAPGFARASVTVGAAGESMQAADAADCASRSPADAIGGRGAVSGCCGEKGALQPLRGAAREVYISGTASIRKAESLTGGGLQGQLETTIENLNRIAAEAGIAPLIGQPAEKAAAQGTAWSGGTARVCGKADAPASGDASAKAAAPVAGSGWTKEESSATGNGCAQGKNSAASGGCARRFRVYLRHASDCAAVAAHLSALLRKEDAVSYVRSDICRAELDIEIEASVCVLAGVE